MSAADHPNPVDVLEADARRVIPRVQSAFAQVLQGIPGRPRRPVEVSRVLGVHGTLAWKVVQVATGSDPLAAAQRLPGASGIEIFLRAAGKAGATNQAISDAREAVRAYHTLIDAHAGDRPSLELMFNGLSTEGRADSDVAYRREGFRCASHVWGVQTRARVMTYFVNASADDRALDVACVHGYVGLRRLRPNSSWTLARGLVVNAEKQIVKTELRREPIAPEQVLAGGIPALRKFCSKPMPPVERLVRPDSIEDRLAPGPIGEAGAMTYFAGEVFRGESDRYQRDPRGYDLYGVQIRTPAQRLIMDLFLSRRVFEELRPELLLFSELSGVPWPMQDADKTDFLPTTDTVDRLGTGPDAVTTTELPEHAALAADVLKRLKWENEEFDVWRLRMEYPVLGTAPVLKMPLPRMPGVKVRKVRGVARRSTR